MVKWTEKEKDIMDPNQVNAYYSWMTSTCPLNKSMERNHQFSYSGNILIKGDGMSIKTKKNHLGI